MCCSDHLHCCPNGYTCDVSAGTCTRESDVMTWFEKTEARVKNVVCPDGQSECPDGNTCCKLASGQYGCCPIPNVSEKSFQKCFFFSLNMQLPLECVMF